MLSPSANTTCPRRTTNLGQPCTLHPSSTEYPASEGASKLALVATIAVASG
jgi:hypothetical protein